MSKHILSPRLNQLAASIAVVFGSLALVPVANAAAPAAGTNISNIASASYNDAAGRSQTVTSNEVKTTVIQVAGFTLEADRTTVSNPNGQVSLSHTLTNTGNGADTFTITTANAAGDDFNFASIAVYADANGDGIPDNNTNLNGQTVTLNAGEAINLVVVTTTPSTAVELQQGLLTISATTSVAGTAPADQTKTNTDTVNVTSNATIVLTKSASVSAVQVGGTIEYTLTYKNTGNTTATNVVLTDVIPANLTYTPGSAAWSGSGTALTDGSDTDGYDFGVTQAGRVTFTIASVAPNTTGTLKFSATVNANVPPGDIINTASASYDPDGNPATNDTLTTNSNQNQVNVAATYLGAINDSSSSNYNDAERGGVQDDIQSITIAQGQTATFNTYVWNRGNSTESYNLTSAFTGFTAGTVVQFFKADGVTPLTDTNGDITPDSGPIAPNSNELIVVKVTAPTNYNGSGSVTVTADPVDNASVAANDVTTLNVNITPATVDLTKNGSNLPADGDGAYVPGTVVQTVETEAGQPALLQLAITNDGVNPDDFNLSYDPATLPAGWTVTFYQDTNNDGQPDGQPITSVSNVGPGQTVNLVAVVTSPADALPGNTDIVFQVNSPITGISDSLKDRVVIDENRSLVFTPARTGQVTPGGEITYSHTLTNTGNVVEGDAAGELSVGFTNTLAGTNTTLFVDLNGDGIATANEQIINGDINSVLPAGLAPGQTITILATVQAPANATDGQQNVTVVTITTTGTINGEAAPAAVNVTDTTTVNDGQTALLKEQALDNNCDGTEDGAYTTGVLNAKPGECVVYRITASNGGSVNVTNLVINDTVPVYTTLSAAPAPSNDGTIGTIGGTATTGSTGTVSNTVGTLSPNAVARLKFGVKVND